VSQPEGLNLQFSAKIEPGFESVLWHCVVYLLVKRFYMGGCASVEMVKLVLNEYPIQGKEVVFPHSCYRNQVDLQQFCS